MLLLFAVPALKNIIYALKNIIYALKNIIYALKNIIYALKVCFLRFKNLLSLLGFSLLCFSRVATFYI